MKHQPLAIVTGLSGNLGQAISNKFLHEGYTVAGTVPPGDASYADKQVNRLQVKVVDLTDEESATSFVRDLVEKHSTIDAAVFTVGGFAMGTIEGSTTALIRQQFQLNFETTWNMLRPVFLQMTQQGSGRIFLIGARPGISPKDSRATVAYGLAKSLLFYIAELMNAEAAGTNVVVSVVVPSTLDTVQNRQAMPDKDPGQWVSPAAIADMIYFYCTPQAAAIREPVIKMYNNA